jgi:CRISPR-associated protein Cas2
MQRYRYLVAYDISDPVRLTKVRKRVKGYGDAMQYSVFVCDLDAREKARLTDDLLRVIKPGVDRVAIIEIGLAGDRDSFEFLGPPPPLPVEGPRVY